jgi:hypothetical protein
LLKRALKHAEGHWRITTAPQPIYQYQFPETVRTLSSQERHPFQHLLDRISDLPVQFKRLKMNWLRINDGYQKGSCEFTADLRR